eukprot:11183587-Lingulodinium_polyedra.AAC.1
MRRRWRPWCRRGLPRRSRGRNGSPSSWRRGWPRSCRGRARPGAADDAGGGAKGGNPGPPGARAGRFGRRRRARCGLHAGVCLLLLA